FQSVNERLSAELDAATAEIRRRTAEMREQLAAPPQAPLDSHGTASFAHLFGDVEDRFFSDPMSALEQADPIGRSLSALSAPA
ncbi:MAG: hypothetical protein ACRD1Y_11395, partial [Terriglobales bacterium]